MLRFTLPLNCAPSFEGDYGFVRYTVKGKIDRPWASDDKVKRVSEERGRCAAFTAVWCASLAAI